MSYQVFARKYRPQTFAQVVGQDHISRTLRNAIAQDRLAHAYIFVGPRGTGKTSSARIFAKAINCTQRVGEEPCSACISCQEIAAGNSLDVLEIDGASNNGVEQVRELREAAKFAPSKARFKIYLIDEVHMLSPAAFNALLKTLEEPPPHLKFLFATTDVQKVLPTILSRCQRFDLRRISSAEIAAHLLHIAENEGFKLSQEAAQAIAIGADGGLRDAESMLDQLVAFCGEKIEEADVLSVFGFTSRDVVAGLCARLFAADTPGALAAVHEQAQSGKDLSRLMGDLIAHLRNLLVAKSDPEALGVELGAETAAAIVEQAGHTATEKLLDLIEQFAAAEGRMKWAANKQMHFEVAVIRAVQTLSSATLDEVLETLTALRNGTPLPVRAAAPASAPAPAPRATTPVSAPVVRNVPLAVAPATAQPAPAPVPVAKATVEPPPAPPQPTPAVAEEPIAARPAPAPAPAPIPAPTPAPVTPTTPTTPATAAGAAAKVDLDAVWPELLAAFKTARPLFGTSLMNAVPRRVENGALVAGFPQSEEGSLTLLDTPANRAWFEEKLKGLTSQKLKLVFELDATLTLAKPPEAEPERDPMEAFKDDALIRRALDLFRAEIEQQA